MVHYGFAACLYMSDNAARAAPMARICRPHPEVQGKWPADELASLHPGHPRGLARAFTSSFTTRARHPLAREPPQNIQTSEMKIFEAKPGRRAGVGNVGKAASQRPRRPRIAAPVQAQELAAARRRLASFKPVCQRGMSEISPPARRSCSRGRTCRHPNRTLARAEKGARQNLPQKFPRHFYTQI